jgi:putative spermidine/putrescine transport system permease protein
MIGRVVFNAVVALLFVFLLAPVILVFPLSLSADSTMAWPPSGWSTRWYIALAHHPGLMAALRNSLILAGIVTILVLLIATPAAVAIARGRFQGREATLALLTAPLVLPTIVLGLALLILFAGYGLIGSWSGLVLAHLLIALPYAIRVLVTSLEALPPALEDAAASLGASPLTVFRRVSLPLMLPGVVATCAIVALVSFDETVISLFVVGPRLTTFPVALFHYVQSRTDPLVAAAAAAMVVVTLLVVLVLDRAIGLRRAIGR